ncbi:cation-transporting ATPase 4 [Pochonia chlamydosporia 170]|uniref:Cation-transporting ATPase 4 n=1 Tax=Pochonia chlamydosporia 170 TaxID=1380566 RepID=A0A179F3J0_METCM|nr:cation-transporting ATPase 4 [Pochonia chlamydosporia 170]OAQ59977.1 cation-transporting ATPase 4 [Pochonia chlamydosporia 170]
MTGNRGPQIIAVVVTFYITSLITIGLRFYTHGFILKRFFAEDYISLVALVLYTGYSACGLLSVKYGLGQHVVDVPPEDRPNAIMYRWIVSVLYIVLSLLTKWIVGLFLLRICPARRWRQITIRTLLGVVTIFSIIYFFIDIWSCQPVEYMWTRYNPIPPAEGTCNAANYVIILTLASALLNVIADVVLPLLPATLIWKAQLPRREKISVICLLLLGSIASVATIVRIPYANGMLDNPDYLYTSTDLGIWSTLEIGIALTASSLATLKPLMKRIRVFSSFSDLNYLTAGSRGRANNTASSTNAAGGQSNTLAGDNLETVLSANGERQEQWPNRRDNKGSMDVELVANYRGTNSPSRSHDTDVESGYDVKGTQSRSWLRD